MAIYLIDAAGALLTPVELPSIPGIGIQMPGNAIEVDEILPPPAEGYAWTISEGNPVQRVDRRGVVFDINTGKKLSHDLLGELPAELTHEPRPSPLHMWLNGQWQLDEELQLERRAALGREWRDMEIRRTDDLVIRHRDELELEKKTTLDVEQYQVMQSYRSALREWPQSPAFPSSERRPVAPDWLI